MDELAMKGGALIQLIYRDLCKKKGSRLTLFLMKNLLSKALKFILGSRE